MASTVEVVLKENVTHLGNLGEVVKVRRGYARNYLLPRGLAVVADRGNVKQVEHEKAVQARRVDKLRADQQSLVDKLQKLRLMLPMEAGEDGKLFGSVTAQDVVDALKNKGIQVDKKKLVMPEKAIKEVGPYEVALKLPYGMEATINLEVKTRA